MNGFLAVRSIEVSWIFEC